MATLREIADKFPAEVKAWVDGKKVLIDFGGDDIPWDGWISSHWVLRNITLKIAPDPPQPKWRAWTVSEIREIYLRERLVVVSKRGADCTQDVVAVSGCHIRLANDGFVLPEALYNGYGRADGSPCGVME